ncbi:hypothetical protein EMCG_01650 [[Emmonsia] crescens]|uniref:Ubiquitin-like protease family profile domain-containing protein n=1 Tax=[Emmonsia] crescens TaxID=73230 RepID=A0A0G2J9I5_9EURO|nr:hypothetical protein EMCG_01650 [Emmonsia crescens UAMH 3008]
MSANPRQKSSLLKATVSFLQPLQAHFWADVSRKPSSLSFKGTPLTTLAQLYVLDSFADSHLGFLSSRNCKDSRANFNSKPLSPTLSVAEYVDEIRKRLDVHRQGMSEAPTEFISYIEGTENPPQPLIENTGGQDIPQHSAFLRVNQELQRPSVSTADATESVEDNDIPEDWQHNMQLNVDDHNMQHNYNNNMAFFQNWPLDVCNSIIHQDDNITTGQPESEVSSPNSGMSSFQEAALDSPLLAPPEGSMVNYGTAAMTPPASARQGQPFPEDFDDIIDWGGGASSQQNLNGDLESAVGSEVPPRGPPSLYLNPADLDALLPVNPTTHGCIDGSLFGPIDAEIDVTMQNLMDVVDALPASAIFELAWGTFRRGEIIDFLKALEPQQWITRELLNYFAAKLSRQGVHILDINCSDPTLLTAMPPPRLLIPCIYSNHWSLVEVHLASFSITHYDSLRQGNGDGSCSHCQNIVSGTTQVQWQFHHADCHQQNDSDDSGVFLLWFLHARAKGLDANRELPDKYRLTLAQVIVNDLKSPPRPDLKRPFDSVDGLDASSIEIEKQWADFSEDFKRCNLVDELRRVADVSINGSCIGVQRASRLLQLALNIASPLVFLSIKHSILHLRQHSGSPSPLFGEDLRGIYQGGVWYTEREEASMMSLRLTGWSVSEKIDQECGEGGKKGSVELTIQRMSDLLSRQVNSPPSDVKSKISNWRRRGLSWARLKMCVDEVNVLCFLPHNTNIFPAGSPIGPTEYRDLKVDEVTELGKIIRAVRPEFVLPRNDGFHRMFLRNNAPPVHFPIESWEDDHIKSLPLDSPQFSTAF